MCEKIGVSKMCENVQKGAVCMGNTINLNKIQRAGVTGAESFKRHKR